VPDGGNEGINVPSYHPSRRPPVVSPPPEARFLGWVWTCSFGIIDPGVFRFFGEYFGYCGVSINFNV
jgi:hypothetical protein